MGSPDASGGDRLRPLALILGATLALGACVDAAESPRRSRGPRLSVLADRLDGARTAFNFARAVAADEGGAVHAVWHDGEGSSGDVWYARSTDDGATWEPVRRLGRYRASEGQATVAAAGSYLYVAWHDHSPGGGIRLARSTDRGETFEPTVTVIEGGAAHPSLAADGRRVHLVWGDHRDGDQAEVYTIRSTDGGASWSNEQRLSDVPFESWVPTVAVERDRVYAAWVDYRDGNEEEYFTRSPDGGVTWDEPVRLTNDSADSWAPSLAVAEGVVHLAWFDRRFASATEVDVERQLNAAMRLVGLDPDPIPPRDPAIYYLPGFTERMERKRSAVEEAAPAWARGGGDPSRLESMMREIERLADAWQTGWEIMYQRSLDGGATWEEARRLTTVPGESVRPSLALAGRDVHIVWFDRRGGRFDVFHRVSTDGGDSWGPEARLSDPSADDERPSIAAAGGRAHVVWVRHESGGDRILHAAVEP